MLTAASLERILQRIPTLTVGVLGDLFLDRYLDIDASLTEVSLETGLDAYQVLEVRACPGAAGTVINNLAALGVKRVHALSVIGDDGEGYELRRALDTLGVVDMAAVFSWDQRRTPTYTKPLCHQVGQPPRELNRLDIKNCTPLPAAAEDRVLKALEDIWPRLDALLVLDQVSLPESGVVTTRVRDRLAELGRQHPAQLILADSRERVGLFRYVSLKPNERECRHAVDDSASAPSPLESVVVRLAGLTERAVFCTVGEKGILLQDPCSGMGKPTLVPAYPVSGPTDIVGAGDSTSAGIACALAAGANGEEAAGFGNLVAAVTIQQIGTTGTASPPQLRRRWRELGGPASP